MQHLCNVEIKQPDTPFSTLVLDRSDSVSTGNIVSKWQKEQNVQCKQYAQAPKQCQLHPSGLRVDGGKSQKQKTKSSKLVVGQ